MGNKKLQRSQAAHERCLRSLWRKPPSRHNAIKRHYHSEVLERQEHAHRVLSLDERRKMFRDVEREWDSY